MTEAARVIVWLAAAWLLALGALAFIRPAIIHRYIDKFVASTRIDVIELALRLIVSLALVGASPETKLPHLFFWFGAGLALTAVPMLFVHRYQRRHAARATAFSKRFLPVMGLVAIALGSLIVWAIV